MIIGFGGEGDLELLLLFDGCFLLWGGASLEVEVEEDEELDIIILSYTFYNLCSNITKPDIL